MPPVRALAWLFPFALVLSACQPARDAQADPPRVGGGAASIQDDVSEPDVVKVAVGSPDHTTLVAALKAADLVDVMSSSGPYTVFAPTNAAFDALPPGTVDDLLKPANKSRLSKVLQHHVTTSALELDFFTDGQELGMVDGTRETITRRNGDTFIGSAKVLGSVRAANGWVHVIDAVLVPKQ